MNRLCYEEYDILKTGSVYIPVDLTQNIDEIKSSLMILLKFQKNVDRIKYVEAAFQEFQYLKTSIQYPTRIGMINVERTVRSFFTEFSIFLNHWQKYYGNHPREKEFRTLFDQITKNAYDYSDDYAMATLLRDYGTHAADIIRAWSWGGHDLHVSCDREALLKDSFFKESKKEIIRLFSSHFISIEPIMKGALEELRKIQDALIAFAIDYDIRKAANQIARITQEMKKYGDKCWYFIEFKESELLTVNIDGELIKYIKGKSMELFRWKEADKLIATINSNDMLA